MSLDNILPLLAERAYIKHKQKELDARAKELDAVIRPVLVEHSAPVSHMGYIFEVTMSPGRATLDRKAMAADGIDLTAYEKVGAPFTVFKITEE